MQGKIAPIVLVRSFIASDTDECSIWHEAIKDVQIDGLPKNWKLSHNAIKLPCEHIFHASAIALHFLTNNMSCPICRDGDAQHKLDVSSIPKEHHDAFRKYLTAYNARNPPETHDMFVFDFSQVMATFRVRLINGEQDIVSVIREFGERDGSGDRMHNTTISNCFHRQINGMSFGSHNPRLIVENAFMPETPIIICNSQPLFDVRHTIEIMQGRQELGHDTLHMEKQLFIENICVGRVKFMLAPRITSNRNFGTGPTIETLAMRNFELHLNQQIIMHAVMHTYFQEMLS